MIKVSLICCRQRELSSRDCAIIAAAGSIQYGGGGPRAVNIH